MSRDEIIQGWKAGKDVGGKDAPPDPAGEVHLSEEELEAVAGGAADDGPTLDCTANQSWCKGTCCFPPLNLGCCNEQLV